MKFDIYDNKFVQAIMDFRNFFRFRKDIKRELMEPKSGMNTLGIKRNWLGNILYTQINCRDADLMGVDYDYDKMIMNKLKPIVQYLGQDLGWSDYLVPQVNNFVDEEDNPTLSYGVLFIFTGYSLTLTKLLITTLILIGSIIGGLFWLLA
jgi:hypothetical protein